MKLKAVVLAGGLGTRLQPYTLLMPKPLLPLGGKPIMEHILNWLKAQGIDDVVIAVGYMRKMIESYFGDGSELGMRIEYARAESPLGTAGQLKTVEPFVDGRFVLLYSDVLIESSISPMVELHERMNAVATMMLMYYSTKLRYGFIEAGEDGRVLEWKEKPEVGGWVNVGCYVMEKKLLQYIPSGASYGMDEAFRRAMAAGEGIYAYRAEGTFLDVGDKEAYLKANREFLRRMGNIP